MNKIDKIINDINNMESVKSKKNLVTVVNTEFEIQKVKEYNELVEGEFVDNYYNVRYIDGIKTRKLTGQVYNLNNPIFKNMTFKEFEDYFCLGKTNEIGLKYK